MSGDTHSRSLTAPHQLRGIKRFFDLAYRTIFGFDYFISYTWRDTDDPDQRYSAECGRNYAVKLRDALRRQQFVCFLDSDDYAKGQNWRWFGQRALQGTSRLILVLSPAVTESQAVLDEVEYFKTTGKAIVPVEFVDCFPTGDTSRLLALIESETLRIREPATALKDGPSEHAVGELVKTFRLTRQHVFRHRLMTSVIGVLTALLVTVAYAGYLAIIQREVAVSNQARAEFQLGKTALERGHIDEALLWWAKSCSTANDATWRASMTNLIGGWSPKLIHTLPHDGKLSVIATSPDGETIFTGGEDGRNMLWHCHADGVKVLALENVGTVSAVEFSRNGEMFLAGTFTKGQFVAHLFDARTGAPLGSPMMHTARVKCMAFSPDDQFVVTGSGWSARLWSLGDCVLRGAPLEFGYDVHGVVFSPDGTQVAVYGGDPQVAVGSAKLWDTRSGNQTGKTLSHDHVVDNVAFSGDGKRMVTGSWDKTARVWMAATGEPLTPPLPHSAGVSAVGFTSNDTMVCTGSWDKIARLWDLQTAMARNEPPVFADPELRLEHSDSILAMKVSSDGWIVTGCGNPPSLTSMNQHLSYRNWDKAAQVWDAGTGNPRGVRLHHDDDVIMVAPINGRNRVITGSSDGTVRIWLVIDKDKGNPLQHQGYVQSVTFDSDGKHVLTGSYEKTARLWDVSTRLLLQEFLHEDDVDSVSFCADRSSVTTWSGTNTALLWKLKTGHESEQASPGVAPLPVEHGPFGEAFCLSGKKLVTNSSLPNGNVQLWDVETGKRLGASFKHAGRLNVLTISPDERTLLVTSHVDPFSQDQAGVAHLIDLRNGRVSKRPIRHNQEITVAAFTPDGRTVITSSKDNTTRFWNADTGNEYGEPLRHEQTVSAISVSPDGNTIVTARDGMVWDVRTRLPRGEAFPHPTGVSTVAFSPDGQSVITGGIDMNARFWDIAPSAIDDRDLPDRLRLSVEVRTAKQIDDNGLIQQLKFDEWTMRRNKLHSKEGRGPCDAPAWHEYHEWSSENNYDIRSPRTVRSRYPVGWSLGLLGIATLASLIGLFGKLRAR